jgi:hypothetical protein
MLNYFKDYFERGMMNVYSMDLLEEMKSVVRDQGSIAAYGRNKDDRVIATALGCVAFAEQLMPRLLQMRMTRDRKEEAVSPVQVPVVDKQINNYLKAIGVGPQ